MSKKKLLLIAVMVAIIGTGLVFSKTVSAQTTNHANHFESLAQKIADEYRP